MTYLRDHCLAPERVDAPLEGAARYGRMFDLPALEIDVELLPRVGISHGFCDGGDCAADSAVEAGWPFFGQYVAHDLTADRSASNTRRPGRVAKHAAGEPRVAIRGRASRLAVYVSARGSGQATRRPR
jgi:hypothetical protein